MFNASGNGTIVNEGTINADTAGGTIQYGDAAGTESNLGTRSKPPARTMNLGGNFTTAGLGTVEATGGTVNLTGVLTGDLSLDATTGSWNLSGGTLQDGTLTESGGAELVIESGSLSGVTVDGTLDLSQVNNANVTVYNGLVLNGTMLLGNAIETTYGTITSGNNLQHGRESDRHRHGTLRGGHLQSVGRRFRPDRCGRDVDDRSEHHDPRSKRHDLQFLRQRHHR